MAIIIVPSWGLNKNLKLSLNVLKLKGGQFCIRRKKNTAFRLKFFCCSLDQKGQFVICNDWIQQKRNYIKTEEKKKQKETNQFQSQSHYCL